MTRYICVHGHFYQPPRENPWLEAVELQDSAFPYHDWNQRITAECYASNARSRILDAQGKIQEIVNNYEKMSFNFGPTLLSWMEKNAPTVYAALTAADQKSQQRFSGHGSALAQAYNHMILPLATHRDRITQIKWGIRDFEHRFKRKPEGLWLPETAVDLDSLDILAENGIRFTILAPRQARRVRSIGDSPWQDVSSGQIDPTRPYTLTLPSGQKLSIFFYNGSVSQAVAFENLLSSGETFSHRLLDGFSDNRDIPQLVHISTDGETYGHHHRHGEMALSYAFHYIESNQLALLTNYGEYLERYPPECEVEIVEHSSWSCVHGVGRWNSNCGCHTGSHPDWTQTWRGPLRAAFDWLRDTLNPLYETHVSEFLKDPWEARNGYIDVILDRSEDSLRRFFERHARGPLTPDEQKTVLNLLELERHLMLMYTSCGWFFDDLSRIETVQVIQYADRALQLAEGLFEQSFEEEFLLWLEQAKSNLPSFKDGRQIYRSHVKPTQVDLARVAAHFVISSLFDTFEKETQINAYLISQEAYQSLSLGKAKLVVGKLRITSCITRETAHYSFGALHFGDHNITGGVRPYRGQSAYNHTAEVIEQTFNSANFTDVIRLLDDDFGPLIYSLKTLFHDEQRKILNRILSASLSEAEGIYRQVYENYSPLMRFLSDTQAPIPKALQSAAEFTLNAKLKGAITNDSLDGDALHLILRDASQLGISLDHDTHAYAFHELIQSLFNTVKSKSEQPEMLDKLANAVLVARSMPFMVNFWDAQNDYYDLLKTVYPRLQKKSFEGNLQAEKWVTRFRQLGDMLSVRLG